MRTKTLGWNVACKSKKTGKGMLWSYCGYKTKAEAMDVVNRGNALNDKDLVFAVVKRVPGTDHYEKPVWGENV